MNDMNPCFYFDTKRSKVITETNDLTRNKNNIYFVIPRSDLLFNEFSIMSKKKVKAEQLLNIQRNYLPFKEDHTNILYSARVKDKYDQIFWISKTKYNNELSVYDEIPESFIFKGDQKRVREFQVFLFRRSEGFEVIYFNDNLFFSIFAQDQEEIPGKISLLRRKYPQQKKMKILSEISLTGMDEGVDIEYLGDSPHHFLINTVMSFKKIHSNISAEKAVNNIRSRMKFTGKFLNIFLVFSFLIFFINTVTYIYLKKERDNNQIKYKKAMEAFELAEQESFDLQKIFRIIKGYPDNLHYLKIVHEVMGQGSYLNELEIRKDAIILKGISDDPEGLRSKVTRNGGFSNVTLRPVENGDKSPGKGSFFMEIALGEND